MRRGIPVFLCLMGLLFAPGIVSAEKKIIYPAQVKKHRPDLPFSPGVQVGNILWVAGQTGASVETGEYPADFTEEVHMTFKRIDMILKDAGYTFDDVVAADVYLTDMSTFATMSGIFKEYFKKDPPARATLGVASLVGKARIEITVTAAK